ncbi:MAG: hypothetical protein WB586_24060 [Chthoniobacterales bacterium]
MVDVADPEWQSMILFGLYTGQRLGDVARLTWVSPLGWVHRRFWFERNLCA